jgi:hypothetical protein
LCLSQYLLDLDLRTERPNHHRPSRTRFIIQEGGASLSLQH